MRSQLSWIEHLATDQGVGSSNLLGRIAQSFSSNRGAFFFAFLQALHTCMHAVRASLLANGLACVQMYSAPARHEHGAKRNVSVQCIYYPQDKQGPAYQNNKIKKTIEPRPSYKLGYQDSNLENAGVRVQCLTIWRQPIIMKFEDFFVSHKLVLYYMSC